MPYVYLDLETRNATPIKVGGYRYAETAQAVLLAYAFGDEPARVWDRLESPDAPYGLYEAMEDPSVTLVAHNAMFDRTILRVVLGIDVPPRRWHCTMAQALAHSLPASLGTLCEVLRVPQDMAKDKEGRKLLQLFCKPNRKGAWNDATTHPAEWARFVNYARLDIEAMRAAHKRMPNWNYTGFEKESWVLDQIINDRGMHIDMALGNGAVDAVDREQGLLAEQTFRLTGGEVASGTQVAALRKYLDGIGVRADSLDKATVTELLAGDLPPLARELLENRQQSGSSSTAKYEALMRAVSWDGRIRGVAQWCGASRTGRWSGRIFQPQNLPRAAHQQHEIDAGVRAFRAGCADLVADNVMKLASSSVRALICAPAGRKLVQSDLSNIEGRVAAWLAGERWKLQAFRDFDAGTGADLYKLAYAKSFMVSPEGVTKDQRQIGKVQELMLQYEGGVGAFKTGAATYRIDLDELAAVAWPAMPPGMQGQAHIMLEWHRARGRNPPKDHGLSDATWLACEGLKLGWRASHPGIVQMWKLLRGAYTGACLEEGRLFRVGDYLRVWRKGAWLHVELPSGRHLVYPSPAARHEPEPCKACDGTGTADGWDCVECEGTGEKPERSARLSYFGVSGYSNRWEKNYTYGGSLFENIVQAVARDVLAWAMPGIEAAGYPIILTVHDEVLTEVPDAPQYNPGHLASLLSAGAPWTEGLPLAAAGFEAHSYRKE